MRVKTKPESAQMRWDEVGPINCDGPAFGVAKAETGPGSPVELANLKTGVGCNAGVGGSLTDNIRQTATNAARAKKTGH